MSQYTIQGVLASAVADAATFTVAYPSGTDAGAFSGAVGHQLSLAQSKYEYAQKFGLTFGTSSITVTNKTGASWPAGSTYILGLEVPGDEFTGVFPGDAVAFAANRARCSEVGNVLLLSLGAPDTADNDSMIKAATSTELPNATTTTYTPDTNGTTPTDGVQGTISLNGVTYWELDCPRNIFCNTTHGSSIVAMTITVTGKDEYRNDMVETITVAATGTDENDSGLKAFKYVRSIAITSAGNATTNTLNVGFGDVIGLPVFLPKAGFVIKEIQDGAAATAGTLVAGIQTAGGSTATTGDVRGTYDPNAACDGSKVFQLIVALPDAGYRGLEQYDG